MATKAAHFYGEVQGGRLILRCPQLVNEFVASLPEGTPIEMVVRKQYDSKTRQQLAYYFACLVKKPSEELGFGVRPDGRHELDTIFRIMYLTENSGLEDERVRELSDLNVADMGKYIESCIQTLAELGYEAEPPDQAWKLRMPKGASDAQDV